MDGVADRCSGRVLPGGWGPPDDAVVVDGGLPAGVGEVAVVQGAEQAGVFAARRPAVDPLDDVVGLAPGRRAIATGERAAAVSGGEGETLSGRGEASRAAVGEHSAG